MIATTGWRIYQRVVRGLRELLAMGQEDRNGYDNKSAESDSQAPTESWDYRAFVHQLHQLLNSSHQA